MKTNNGLKDFPELRDQLIKDATILLGCIQAETGTISDIISGLKACQSSLEFKVIRLKNVWEDQSRRPSTIEAAAALQKSIDDSGKGGGNG